MPTDLPTWRELGSRKTPATYAASRFSRRGRGKPTCHLILRNLGKPSSWRDQPSVARWTCSRDQESARDSNRYCDLIDERACMTNMFVTQRELARHTEIS